MESKMIFNITQANLFIKHGCRVMGVGLGRKNKIYVLFLVNDTFNSMMEKWNSKSFINKFEE